MSSIDEPGKGGCRTVRGVRHHDCPCDWAWDVTVDGRPEVSRLTNPAVGRDIGSAAFHATLVQVEQVR